MAGVALRWRIAALVAGARPGLRILAGVFAAVAGGTLTRQPRVVHRSRHERRRAGVADIALPIVGNMGRALAQGSRAVVAT